MVNIYHHMLLFYSTSITIILQAILHQIESHKLVCQCLPYAGIHFWHSQIHINRPNYLIWKYLVNDLFLNQIKLAQGFSISGIPFLTITNTNKQWNYQFWSTQIDTHNICKYWIITNNTNSVRVWWSTLQGLVCTLDYVADCLYLFVPKVDIAWC